MNGQDMLAVAEKHLVEIAFLLLLIPLIALIATLVKTGTLLQTGTMRTVLGALLGASIGTLGALAINRQSRRRRRREKRLEDEKNLDQVVHHLVEAVQANRSRAKRVQERLDGGNWVVIPEFHLETWGALRPHFAELCEDVDLVTSTASFFDDLRVSEGLIQKYWDFNYGAEAQLGFHKELGEAFENVLKRRMPRLIDEADALEGRLVAYRDSVDGGEE